MAICICKRSSSSKPIRKISFQENLCFFGGFILNFCTCLTPLVYIFLQIFFPLHSGCGSWNNFGGRTLSSKSIWCVYMLSQLSNRNPNNTAMKSKQLCKCEWSCAPLTALKKITLHNAEELYSIFCIICTTS